MTPGRAYALGLIHAVLVFSVFIAAQQGDIAAPRQPPAFTVDQAAATDLRVDMEPLTATVRFLATADWLRERPGDNAAAFSQPFQTPCVITVPADGSAITVTPADGDAKWTNPDIGTILAHEFLHCLRGPWHPPWSMINLARLAKSMDASVKDSQPQPDLLFSDDEIRAAELCSIHGEHEYIAWCAGGRAIGTGLVYDARYLGELPRRLVATATTSPTITVFTSSDLAIRVGKLGGASSSFGMVFEAPAPEPVSPP